MPETLIPELISLAEALGIISTLIVIFYFSRKEMKNLSVDIETRVLNDLDEKMHEAARILLDRPELTKVIDPVEENSTPEAIYAFYILFLSSHGFHMYQRNALKDNEWMGWKQWIKNAFRGTLTEQWKRIEPYRWFDPAFQDFISKEIVQK